VHSGVTNLSIIILIRVFGVLMIMDVVNDLSPEQLFELKRSISGLELIIPRVYSHRKPRDLLGGDGILVRTLGANWGGPSRFESQYFDSKRGEDADTEFAEVLEALGIYDANPSRKNEVELLLEVGDILFQKEIVNLKHRSDENYGDVMEQFDSALDYVRGELERRSLSFDKVRKFAEVKYGSRAWLSANGHNSKDKILEGRLCLEAYDE